MLTNVQLTDPQGQTFTDAVVRVKEANRESSTNTTTTENLVTDASDYSKAASVTTDNRNYENDYLRCVFLYWPNQAAFDEGRAPYVLMNPSSNLDQNFQINRDELEKTKYAGLGIEDVCELYFTDMVTPLLV